MLYYLILINAAAMLIMCLDKNLARLRLRRIPEGVLLFFAVLGGSLGELLGMLIFRHKTRKPKFFITVPVLLVLHGVLFCILRA